MSIVCWLGSVPHTSGKVVNLNTCINIFPLVLYVPNDPLYDSGSGAWSWLVSNASSHAYLNSTAAPTPCTGYKRFVCAELSSAPDVRDDSIQKRLTLKPSVELLNGGKLEGSCFHASINMFSLSILIHVSQKVKNRIRHFQNFGRRNVFNNTVSLFKRGCQLSSASAKAHLSPARRCGCFLLSVRQCLISRVSGESEISQKVMRWWQIFNTPGINNTKCNHSRAERPSDWTGKQNKTKKGDSARKQSIHFMPLSVCLPPVRHDHYHEARHRGLSRPHLYQQAGIKLSNYPPRPLTWPWTLVPFARLACSQMQQAGMWKHILMTVLFQSQSL